jgi:hypothetical protein
MGFYIIIFLALKWAIGGIIDEIRGVNVRPSGSEPRWKP